MAIQKKGKITRIEDGVTYISAVYSDSLREYDEESGKKKFDILNKYSEAKQRNIIAKAVLSIAKELNIDSDEIFNLETMVNDIFTANK